MSQLRAIISKPRHERIEQIMGKKQYHHAVKPAKVLDEKIAAKLSAAGLEKVGQVRKLTDQELRAVLGIGPKAVEAIRIEVPAV